MIVGSFELYKWRFVSHIYVYEHGIAWPQQDAGPKETGLVGYTANNCKKMESTRIVAKLHYLWDTRFIRIKVFHFVLQEQMIKCSTTLLGLWFVFVQEAWIGYSVDSTLHRNFFLRVQNVATCENLFSTNVNEFHVKVQRSILNKGWREIIFLGSMTRLLFFFVINGVRILCNMLIFYYWRFHRNSSCVITIK